MSKSSSYLSWEDYFMAVAYLSAKRSKDPRTTVGACIVNNKNVIVGIGYNGMPTGCNDDEFPWHLSEDVLENKLTYVCHAEMNAVLNKNCADVDGCTIYVSLFPCNDCAKVIIQSGIKHIVYVSNKNEGTPTDIAAKKMFESAGVDWKQYIPKQNILIDFNSLPVSPEKRSLPRETSKDKDDALQVTTPEKLSYETNKE